MSREEVFAKLNEVFQDVSMKNVGEMADIIISKLS